MDNNQQNNANNPTIRDSLMNMFGKGDDATAASGAATPQPSVPTPTPPTPPAVPEPTPSVPPAPEPAPVVPEVVPTPTPPTPEPTPTVPTPVTPEPLPVVPSVEPAPAPVETATTKAVDNLPEDMQESILDKTLKRVAEVMTEEDLTEFEKIDKEDPSGNAGKYFLMTRVPRFEEILKEELKLAQKQHQASSGSLSS